MDVVRVATAWRAQVTAGHAGDGTTTQAAVKAMAEDSRSHPPERATREAPAWTVSLGRSTNPWTMGAV